MLHQASALNKAGTGFTGQTVLRTSTLSLEQRLSVKVEEYVQSWKE